MLSGETCSWSSATSRAGPASWWWPDRPPTPPGWLDLARLPAQNRPAPAEDQTTARQPMIQASGLRANLAARRVPSYLDEARPFLQLGADPDLAQLAVDPNAAPAGVLPGEPEDERTDRGIDRWPASATGLAVRPLPPHELGMRRRRVDGVTRKATQRSRGMTRLAATRTTRRRLAVILPPSAGQVSGEHGRPANDGDDQAGPARPGELRLWDGLTKTVRWSSAMWRSMTATAPAPSCAAIASTRASCSRFDARR